MPSAAQKTRSQQWTKADLAALKRIPSLGIRKVASTMKPKRSLGAIRQKALTLGISTRQKIAGKTTARKSTKTTTSSRRGTATRRAGSRS